MPSTLPNVILQAIGEGIAVLDISMSYYISGNRPDNYIAVSVAIIKETLNSVTVKPCISWTGPATSGMLVAEVEMPTGFRPDNDALKVQKLIKRHETNGRNIALYFDGINRNGRTCVEVKMERADPVVKSQACHVTAYDYYEPTHQAMERYEFGLLKNATICSVCPLCQFCTGTTGVGQIGVGK
ncbi:C3 and PZP-like alpha-2-macroglobulin domain-containing protein 8 [Mercenaria mercenaria]|uniref:C3 and PZP-like alpha-2-macroglobulin domain-containing protein 8 n=1 Tax=Mercenaria mercenaria TaxID=6596 RepID=UPI00234EFC7C|nr:C3 and PZP-like alpha-2-macroglobulin domain-containing protein 8 [Mercenaria mercenaria]